MRRSGIIGLLLLALGFSAPVAAALFRVWVNQDAVQLGYELGEAAKERRALRAQHKQLEVELAAELSPERLMRLADRLGLRRPTPDQVYGGGE